MSKPLQRRTVFTSDAKFAVVRTDGKQTLTGYALVWNVLSTDRGGYRVRLARDSATFATPTMALFHHDFSKVIGNTENKTLRMKADDYGVKVEIDLPNTPTGNEVATLVEEKYIRGMSFSMMNAPDGTTTREDGQEVFNATAFVVDEVTVTGTPGFIEATVDMKAADAPTFSRLSRALQLHRHKFSNLMRS
jgi:HK97 family phage prohead protease